MFLFAFGIHFKIYVFEAVKQPIYTKINDLKTM